MIKLFGNRESGHSYKVALCLHLLGLPYRYEEIDIFVSLEDRGECFRRVSRYGEVPVLVHRHQPIVQSNAILLYLARMSSALLGDSELEHAEIEEWLFWEMSRLSVGIANLRFLRRFEAKPDVVLIEHFVQRSVAALETLDRCLNGRQFLVGPHVSIADVSCCGYLYWLSEAGLDINRYPIVRQWLERLAATPNWRSPGALLGTSQTFAPPSWSVPG